MVSYPGYRQDDWDGARIGDRISRSLRVRSNYVMVSYSCVVGLDSRDETCIPIGRFSYKALLSIYYGGYGSFLANRSPRARNSVRTKTSSILFPECAPR